MNTFLPAFTQLNSLYGAFRLAHWNVVGANFYSAHLLFQRIYGMLGAQIDPMAEQIRMVGIEIPAESLNQTEEIDWVDCQDLLIQLNRKLFEYIQKIKEARKEAEGYDNIGFVALLETLLGEANVIQYLIKSSFTELELEYKLELPHDPE